MASESQRASAMTPLMGVPSPSPRRRLLAAGFAEPDRALRAIVEKILIDHGAQEIEWVKSGCVIASHAGPGAFGISALAAK